MQHMVGGEMARVRTWRIATAVGVVLAMIATSLAVLAVVPAPPAGASSTLYEVPNTELHRVLGVNDDGEALGLFYRDSGYRLAKYDPTDGRTELHPDWVSEYARFWSSGAAFAPRYPLPVGVEPGGTSGEYVAAVDEDGDRSGPVWANRDLVAVGNTVSTSGGVASFDGYLWSGLGGAPELIPGIDSPIAVNGDGELVYDTGIKTDSEFHPSGQSYGERLSASSIIDFFDDGRVLVPGAGSTGRLIAPGGSVETIPLRPSAANESGVVVGSAWVTGPGGEPVQEGRLRTPDGSVLAVHEMLPSTRLPDGSQLTAVTDVLGISDNCHVTGWGEATRPSGSVGIGVRFVAQIPDCEAPGLRGSLGRSDGLGPNLIDGEARELRLRAWNTADEPLTGVTLAAGPTYTVRPGDEIELTVDLVEGTDFAGTLAAAGDGEGLDVEDLLFEVTAVGSGNVTISFELQATRSDGTVEDLTVSQTFTVRSSVLGVEVAADPELLELETQERTDDGGDTVVETVPGKVVVSVTVSNELDEPIPSFVLPDDLTIAKADDYDGGTVRVVEAAGPCEDRDACVALAEERLPSADTSPEEGEGQDPGDGAPDPNEPEEPQEWPASELEVVEHGPLAPNGEEGDTKTLHYVFEVRQPGAWDASALVQADDPRSMSPSTSLGTGRIRASEKVALTFFVEEPDQSLIRTGETKRVSAVIENRTNDETFTIASMVPLIVGNASGGELIPLDADFLPGDACCDTPFNGELAPGERVQLHGLLRTMPENGTRAEVSYELHAFDEDEEPLDPERMLVDGGPFTISLDDSTPPVPEADYLAMFAGLSVGAGQALVDFVWGPVQFAAWAAKGVVWDLPKAVITSTSYFIEFWATATLEEKEQWAADVAAWFERAVDPITYEEAFAGGAAAVEAYVLAQFESFFQAWNGGDWFEAYRQIGVAGGNVALELLTSGMFSFAKAKKSQDIVELADFQRQERISTTPVNLPAHVKALGVGARLNDFQLRSYGVTREMAQALRRFAQENSLVLTFRRRNPDSMRWLERGAVQKPQELKMKTVNELDAKYLGYPDSEKGALVLKEVTEDLDTVLARVDADPDLAGSDAEALTAVKDAVRSRWAKRKDEWVEFTSPTKMEKVKGEKNPDGTSVWVEVTGKDGAPELNPYNYLAWDEAGEMPWPGRPDGQPMYFDYEANPVDVTNAPMVTNGFALEPNVGTDGKRYFNLLVEDRRRTDLPPEERLRRVTGDFDGLDFRNADGSVLSNDRLIEVWQGLNEITGLDHGETVSWAKKKNPLHAFKAQILADHGWPDGDPLVQWGPDGEVRTVLLDPKLSVFEDAPNSRNHYVFFRGGYQSPRFTARIMQPVVFLNVLKALPLVYPITWLAKLGCAAFRYDDGDSAVILRQQGPRMEQWTPEGGWRPVEAGQTCSAEVGEASLRMASTEGAVTAAATAGETLLVRPSTEVTEHVEAGATTLHVKDVSVWAGTPSFPDGSAWFEPGQRVVVNPGGATEEMATISELGSLILDAPLQHAHERGEIVAVIEGSSPPPEPPGPSEPPSAPGGPTHPDPEPEVPLPAPCADIPQPFSDVQGVHAEAVACLAQLGLIEGFADGTYRPGRGLTRGQLASMLVRWLDGQSVLPGSAPDAFSDDDGGTHEVALDLLASLGIFEGYGDGTVGPNDVLTRGQAATVLVAVLDLLGVEPEQVEDAFTDDDGSVHEPALGAAASLGLVQGFGGGIVGPERPVTRGQIASMLMRLLALVTR